MGPGGPTTKKVARCGFLCSLSIVNGSFCIFDLVTLLKESHEKWGVHNGQWREAPGCEGFVSSNQSTSLTSLQLLT